MTTSNEIQLTDQERAELLHTEQEATAYQFMRSSRDFKPSKANMLVMQKHMGGLDFTVANLERVFSEHRSEFELDEYVPPAPTQETNERVLPPWGELTKLKIRELVCTPQFKEWNKHREFRKHVERVLNGRSQFDA